MWLTPHKPGGPGSLSVPWSMELATKHVGSRAVTQTGGLHCPCLGGDVIPLGTSATRTKRLLLLTWLSPRALLPGSGPCHVRGWQRWLCSIRVWKRSVEERGLSSSSRSPLQLGLRNL